tara:strand:- start:764 stop:1402 length:639 start_codon:yes stop_codon:yes gene_type:complete
MSSKRIITGLALMTLVIVVLAIQNFWLFTSVICFICFYSLYEWIQNKFKNIFFGFLLIFNFGFWSIFLLSYSKLSDYYDAHTLFFLYGIIIFNTALFDTFAFIIGSKFGRIYIVKKISPNKTLEGLIGGLLASLFLGIFSAMNAEANFLIVIYFTLGGFFAFIGDLLISYFKRLSDVKDTGTLLPGHGGVLDRIDSHLLATPILIIIFLLSQ